MDKQLVRNGNWFIDQLNLYQVANSDYQSIKKNFIVREAEYNIIIHSLMDKSVNDPLQNELILGRRGSGKSTLLKRIEIEILENKKLNKKYIPINLAEEQAGIYRLFDLWEQVLIELNCILKINSQLKDFNEFVSEKEYTRYLYQTIHDICQKNNKKIVLLLDNFDRIVENFKDDGNLLRETLINYNDIVIISGSTRMDEHFWKYDMPFYEFFRRHHLEALSREEIYKLLNFWSVSLKIPELKTFVKNNPGKIENIRILTDGLPRTLQFFIQMVLQDANAYGYDYLKKIMDNVTPLYQERLNYLTPQLRKIILEMAFIWEACNTKQLVEKCKMESKLISANLRTLTDKGIVEKIDTSKKNHLYRISERFFNMWLIITQGNPEQKRKAKWLSIFMENWYDAIDLKNLANKHINNMKDKVLSRKDALILSKALSQCKYISTKERDNIIELTENLKDNNKENSIIELPLPFQQISLSIEKYIEDKNYKKALELAQTIENEDDGRKFFIIAFIFNLLARNKEAETYYQLAIEKGDNLALFNLALLYDNQNKNLEAEKYYLLAIDNGFEKALNNLAVLYVIQKKYSEAEKFYLLAIEKGKYNALFNLALLYELQEKYAEAEKYYLFAIEKGDYKALNNLALIYAKQENYKKAEMYFLKAFEKGANIALYNLAILYDKQKKYSDAESYYLLAIENGFKNAIFNLALIYDNQERYEEAEKYYLLAIDNGDNEALNNLALLYENQEKFNEAEKYYLLAIEKGNDEALNNLALLYEVQEKFAEAEKFFLLAIEKGNENALNNIALLYYFQNIYKEKALYYINQYNEKKLLLLIIELWNGIFNDFENRVNAFVKENIDDLDFLILSLFIHQQKNLVLKLFNNQEFGIKLQEKNNVLYYVSLLLNNKIEDNLNLRIPPEIKSTIDEVIDFINEKQKFYGYIK